MANKSKNQVKEELNALGVPFSTDNYKELCEMLTDALDSSATNIEDAPPETAPGPVIVTIVNKVKKRNVFLADSVRDENDKRFLHKEIGQRKYKGKIDQIVTIKHCERNAEGEWVTEFDIVLKD
jgi:hypothetical protein